MERHLPHLIATGLAAQLRVVILAGERITAEDVRRYAQSFPNARMIVYYAANELGGIPGIATWREDDAEILYAPCDTYHFELIDRDSNVVREDGVEGEITLTTLWTEHNNLPLIRYATGDVAVRRHTKDGVRYLVLGRKNTDRIKLPKGELRVEEVERAVRMLLGTATASFELHYYKREQARPKIVIKLLADEAKGDPSRLAEHLQDEIRISNAESYAVLIRDGFHLPLEVVFVPSFGISAAKKKYFFVHEEG
jgi:phenylacetate-coenzyme A ligase PaaK-like adenylate-forming protein